MLRVKEQEGREGGKEGTKEGKEHEGILGIRSQNKEGRQGGKNVSGGRREGKVEGAEGRKGGRRGRGGAFSEGVQVHLILAPRGEEVSPCHGHSFHCFFFDTGS